MTENDGRGPLVEYLRFVCRVNGETRAYIRIGMNAPRGGPANHVIESDAHVSNGLNCRRQTETCATDHRDSVVMYTKEK
jgi:hypothetical protein